MAEQFQASSARYLAVLDRHGKTLAGAGSVPERLALASAPLTAPTLSDVVRQGAIPVIEYGIPFETKTGRRSIVRGVPLPVMAIFLHDYLTRLPNVDGAGLAITDRNDVTIERQGQIGPPAAISRERLSTTAAVLGTPWTLRLEADRDHVLAGVNRLAWLPWLLLASLTLAALTGPTRPSTLARS